MDLPKDGCHRHACGRKSKGNKSEWQEIPPHELSRKVKNPELQQVPDNEREGAGFKWRLSEGGGWRGELSLKSLVKSKTC